MPDCNIRVVCRFRPQNEREKQEALKGNTNEDASIELTRQGATITIKGNKSVFALDHILPSSTQQEEVYEVIAKPTVIDLLNGYNGTIFAYGQTGAGKSFTMFGPDVETQPQLRGIIPRSISLIFDSIMNDSTGSEFTIKCSFLEIYKETVNDLLNPKAGPLKVRETPARGTWVDGLTEEFVTSEKEVLDLIRSGEKCRSVAYTKMNATSSRSHSLFTLVLQQKSSDGSLKTGKLNLADLAGSEKVGKTGAVGETLDEAKKINQSLSALGNCINALTKSKRGHVPFRDSKLTFILRESLGGNSKTTLVVNCSPDKFNIDETLSTLQFAQRAKMIKNSVSMNKQKSVEELNQIIVKLTKEIAQLKSYIQGLGHVVPKGLDVTDKDLSAHLASADLNGAGEGEGEGEHEREEEGADVEGGGEEEREEERSQSRGGVDTEEYEQQLQLLEDAKAELETAQNMLFSEKTTSAKLLAKVSGLEDQLQSATQNLEKKTTEVQEGLERIRAAEEKWNEEREQMKATIEDLKRQHAESDRKMKVLHEQQTDTNNRYDHMMNEMKSQGNDAQAKLAEQLMETEGMLRHRELILSEVAEQLAEEQATKSQTQTALAELKELHAKQTETVQKQERLIMEMTTSIYLSNQEKDEHLETQEKLTTKVKRLEEKTAAQQSEIQNLVSKIQEFNTPPSSPNRIRHNNQSTIVNPNAKSRIVRPVTKKKSSSSLTSSIWSLFSPSKPTQEDELTTSQEFELSSYGGAKLVLKQGFLIKQGINNLKSWKRRRCVLRGDSMDYMGEDNIKKGTITLDAHSRLTPTDEFTFKKNSFGIFHPANPAHFFYAESSDECSAWMEAILAVIEKSKQDKNSNIPAFPGGQQPEHQEI